MSRRTKKVGSSGRLGARYGVRIRKRIADIESESKGRHECPKCRAAALTRKANGIWICRKCGAHLASSSYMPTAPVAVRREVAEVLAKVQAKEEREEMAEEAPGETEELPEKKAKKKKADEE